MYSIGEFARFGQVSVRMLRHYDTIGLLRPAYVHPYTGYRAYSAEQLGTLRRVVALKGLGLRLDDVVRVVCDGVDDDEVRRLLESARLEVARRVAEDTDRLVRIDAELRRLEGEEPMSVITEIEYRSIPPLRVARLVGRAPGYGPQNIGPVVGPMFGKAEGLFKAAGIRPASAPVAEYSGDPESEEGVTVVVAFPVSDDVEEVPGMEITELPGLDQAAVTTYHGAMVGIGPAWMEFLDGVRTDGRAVGGACREVYLTEGGFPESDWDTLLVQEVES